MIIWSRYIVIGINGVISFFIITYYYYVIIIFDTIRLKVNEQLDDMIENKKQKKNFIDSSDSKIEWQQDIMNQNLILNYNAFQTILKSKESQLNVFTWNEKSDR